ncbi:MAG: hypothetical protein M3Q39_03860 [Actinomycetota bacterium]|nr:hypothetical protein [Actinomycetota bacterium]
MIGGGGEGFLAVGDGAGVAVDRREAADELQEVTGVRAMLRTVLLTEVENRVEWNGSEVKGDLLEAQSDDAARGRQSGQVECVEQDP